MTQEQAVRSACRYVVVFLLIAAIGEIISVPSALLNLQFELRQASAGGVSSAAGAEPAAVHFLRSAILACASLALRLALNPGAALWFYRGGPKLERFFGLIGEHAGLLAQQDETPGETNE